MKHTNPANMKKKIDYADVRCVVDSIIICLKFSNHVRIHDTLVHVFWLTFNNTSRQVTCVIHRQTDYLSGNFCQILLDFFARVYL